MFCVRSLWEVHLQSAEESSRWRCHRSSVALPWTRSARHRGNSPAVCVCVQFYNALTAVNKFFPSALLRFFCLLCKTWHTCRRTQTGQMSSLTAVQSLHPWITLKCSPAAQDVFLCLTVPWCWRPKFCWYLTTSPADSSRSGASRCWRTADSRWAQRSRAARRSWSKHSISSSGSAHTSSL